MECIDKALSRVRAEHAAGHTTACTGHGCRECARLADLPRQEAALLAGDHEGNLTHNENLLWRRDQLRADIEERRSLMVKHASIRLDSAEAAPLIEASPEVHHR